MIFSRELFFLCVMLAIVVTVLSRFITELAGKESGTNPMDYVQSK